MQLSIVICVLFSAFIVEQNVPNGILCVDGGRSGSFRLVVRYVGSLALIMLILSDSLHCAKWKTTL